MSAHSVQLTSSSSVNLMSGAPKRSEPICTHSLFMWMIIIGANRTMWWLFFAKQLNICIFQPDASRLTELCWMEVLKDSLPQPSRKARFTVQCEDWGLGKGPVWNSEYKHTVGRTGQKGPLPLTEDICQDRVPWGPPWPDSATSHVPALGVPSGEACLAQCGKEEGLKGRSERPSSDFAFH